MGDYSFLLADRLRPPIDLLQQHLHEIRLANTQILHLFQVLFGFQRSRWLQCLSQPFRRLLLAGEFLFARELFLNDFGVERLQAVRNEFVTFELF